MKLVSGVILVLVWSVAAIDAAGAPPLRVQGAGTALTAAPAPHRAATPDNGQPVALTIGPQRLAYDSLIHKAREHRGAIAAWELNDHTRVQGFGVGPAGGSNAPSLAGRRNDGYRLSGLIVEHAPQLPRAAGARLRLGWISGHERIAEGRARRSTGWSAAADTAVLSERLRLRAEYAASTLVSEASPSADGEGDAAYRLGLELHAPAASPVDWHLGSEISEVGAGFGSLGNPSVTNDRVQLNTYGGATLGDWQLELGLVQRRDNPDGDPASPVVASDRLNAATTWTPSQPALARAVGTPKYRLNAEFATRRHLPAGDGAIEPLPRQRSMKLTLHSEFTRPRLQWGMRANAGVAPGTVGEIEGPAVRALALELYGRFDDAAGLSLKPTLSWQRRFDPATDAADERWRAKLASPSLGLRHDVRGQFDLAVEHRDRWSREDELTADLGAKLVWTLQSPSPKRRGLALAFSGALTDAGSATAGDGDYRLMVSLSTDESLAAW